MKQILPLVVVLILLIGCKPSDANPVEEVMLDAEQESAINSQNTEDSVEQDVLEQEPEADLVAVQEPKQTDSEKPVVVEKSVEQPQVKNEPAEVQTEVKAKAQYLAYSQTQYGSLLGKKPFALFFHAQWCHICRDMEKDIKVNLSSFADGTVILQADYDSETELKKTYGIRSQSVIVLIDASGKAVKTLVAPSSAELKSAFASVL